VEISLHLPDILLESRYFFQNLENFHWNLEIIAKIEVFFARIWTFLSKHLSMSVGSEFLGI